MHRLRIIAGPNGSGKTTLTSDLKGNYHFNFGCYINADEIEALLKKNGKLGFKRYLLKVNQQLFTDFFATHPLHITCKNVQFTVTRNTLYLNNALDNFSYFAALLADFIRHK